ncbi:MAG TPA: hypothetical protein VFX28_22155, partial [Methylomirabilota bacterium]|nr:hypothetical protein [Methylomirabilota bacterium]
MTGTRPPLVAVATVAPSPVTTGYALRAYHLLRELARDWEVTLVAPPACGNGTDGAAALVDHVVPVPVRGRWAFLPTQFDPAPLRAAAMQVVAERRPAAILLWSGAEFLTFGVSHLPPAVADRIDCMDLTAWRDRI